MADFADRLKLYRTMYDLTMDELASRLNTHKQVIHRYENRLQIPKIDTVEEYARLLNVSVTWLIGYDDGFLTDGQRAQLCELTKKMSNEQLDALLLIAKTMNPTNKAV